MATISEIAAAAGVGVTTVSRYLNHHPYISADKKARIEAAIKTLGYTPVSYTHLTLPTKA
ncbi:Transcriptional regulator, LacI family [Lactobacillus rhamnosus Lc 705] [Lacticaseibacillus rhamnosus]|nr:Transcriptional regulator, LacI family [Lactobacillus rhamnosus Lc 705] [Lacticaseibacillus rhamnosus]